MASLVGTVSSGAGTAYLPDLIVKDLVEDADSDTREQLDAAYAGVLSASGADDSATWAAAVTALPAAGGIIRLRRGAYTIGTTVVLDKPVMVIADGGGVTVTATASPFDIASDGAHVEGIKFVSSGGTARDFLKKSTGVTNYTGLRVTNCRFDGFAVDITKRGRTIQTGATDNNGTGMHKDVQIVGCEFTNYAQNYTIEIGGAEDTVVERCWIHDVGIDSGTGDGIKVLAGSQGTRIIDNTIEDTTRDGMDIFDAHDTTITGNTIRNPGTIGIDAKWNVDDANPSGRDLIANNRCYGAGGTAFSIDVHDALVIGNFAVDSVGVGFAAGASSDGELVDTERVQFIGNHAINSGGAGFSFPRGNGFVVMGNVAEGGAGNGIALGANATGFTIMGNRCVNNTSSDINVNATGAPTHFLAGNTTDDATYNRNTALPNNIPQYVYDSAGTVKEWLRMSAGGTLTLGSSGIAVTTLPAGTRVVVSNELRVDGAINHDGASVGFYGTAPVAKQTGVAVDAAGIHAALVALGLISA